MKIKNIKNLGLPNGSFIEGTRHIDHIAPIFKRFLQYFNVPHWEDCCEVGSVNLPVSFLPETNDLVYYDPQTKELVNIPISGGGGGDFIPLSGTVPGEPITGSLELIADTPIFFGPSGQNISQGSFDNGTGGNKGISLNCAVNYEFNWQGGKATVKQGATTVPFELNSSLKIVDGSEGLGKVLTSDADGLATWATLTGGGGGTDSNFATSNLTATGNRTHDFNGNFLVIEGLNGLILRHNDGVVDNTVQIGTGTSGLYNSTIASSNYSSVQSSSGDISNTNSFLFATSGTNASNIQVNADGTIQINQTSHLEINNSSGNSGQVITSQGLGLPVIWADASVATPSLQEVVDQSDQLDTGINFTFSDPIYPIGGIEVFSGANRKFTLSDNAFNIVNFDLSDLVGSLNLNYKVPASSGTLAILESPTFTGTVGGITKAMVGLGNVDNTTDLLKPISTATQTALNLKANLASPTFTGTVGGITKAMVGLANADNTTDANKPVSTATQTALNLKANLASPTFTGTVGGITKAMVGLANVDNTTDAAKPVSSAQQTALDLKANLASPTFTGTVSGITKTMVGLANVDNTTDLAKPISTATQAYVDSEKIDTKVANYTLAVSDLGRTVETNMAGANTVTINSTTLSALAVGGKINIVQYGAGQHQ